MAKNKKNHHLRKIGGVWYFEKMVNGKRIKKALGGSVTEARRLRDQYLKEILVYGGIQEPDPEEDGGVLFGEFAKTWANIKAKEIKNSTMRDYRSAMNLYVLPRFGNTPIKDVTYLDLDRFKSELNCSSKRINNILVPMRSIFKMAFKSGIVDDNIMLKVDNLRSDPPMINPLTPEEVGKVLLAVDPHYKEFFATAFFTGMRFGEMAALKKSNVALGRGIIRICETLVYGVEGRPKTKKSNRDIDILPPVAEALEKQIAKTDGESLETRSCAQGNMGTSSQNGWHRVPPAYADSAYFRHDDDRCRGGHRLGSKDVGAQLPPDDLHEVLLLDKKRNEGRRGSVYADLLRAGIRIKERCDGSKI